LCNNTTQFDNGPHSCVAINLFIWDRGSLHHFYFWVFLTLNQLRSFPFKRWMPPWIDGQTRTLLNGTHLIPIPRATRISSLRVDEAALIRHCALRYYRGSLMLGIQVFLGTWRTYPCLSRFTQLFAIQSMINTSWMCVSNMLATPHQLMEKNSS
jgi:hypothetical protein